MRNFIFVNNKHNIMFFTQANKVEELGWTLPLTEESTYLVSIDGKVFRFADEPSIIEIKDN